MKSISSYKRLLPVTLIAVLLLAIITIPVSANSGLTVSNAVILTNVTPGETLTQKITVTIGSTDRATDMSVQVAGAAQSVEGGYELLDASHDTSQYSAREFVTVDKSSFHLEPGGSEDVTATIQVPQNVGSGGRYAIINIATKAAAGAGVGIITAVSVPVYLTIKGSQLVHTGKITGLSASKVTSGQPINILTNFQNTGNHHFKVQGEVTVKNAQGQTLYTISIPVTSSSIVPGATRQLKTTLTATDALAAGTHTIDSKVMLEDGTLLDKASNTFEVATQYVPPPAVGTPSSASVGATTQSVPPPAVGTSKVTPSNASTGVTTQSVPPPAQAGWVIPVPVAITAGIIVVAIVAILFIVWRRR